MFHTPKGPKRRENVELFIPRYPYVWVCETNKEFQEIKLSAWNFTCWCHVSLSAAKLFVMRFSQNVACDADLSEAEAEGTKYYIYEDRKGLCNDIFLCALKKAPSKRASYEEGTIKTGAIHLLKISPIANSAHSRKSSSGRISSSRGSRCLTIFTRKLRFLL